MKWLALFWVYRRESLSGWKRGWRKASPLNRPFSMNEVRGVYNLPPIVTPINVTVGGKHDAGRQHE